MSLSFLGREARPDDRERPLTYDQFRAGVTFDEIREELSVEQAQAKESGRYMFVTRATVLGRMKERKEGAYAAYLRGWKEREAIRSRGGVSFMGRREALAAGLPF